MREAMFCADQGKGRGARLRITQGGTREKSTSLPRQGCDITTKSRPMISWLMEDAMRKLGKTLKPSVYNQILILIIWSYIRLAIDLPHVVV
jgi:hypothetical protein